MAGTHRRRTLRGIANSGVTKRLIVDDGRLNHGYRVVRFEIFPVDMASAAADCSGVLALDYDATTLEWRADDNRQIAWSSTTMSTSYSLNNKTDIIDPDHVALMDLWILAYTNGSDDRVNYLIELETVDLTDDQAILTLIKERSQDDLR
jgi:hypothetical protein